MFFVLTRSNETDEKQNHNFLLHYWRQSSALITLIVREQTPTHFAKSLLAHWFLQWHNYASTSLTATAAQHRMTQGTLFILSLAWFQTQTGLQEAPVKALTGKESRTAFQRVQLRQWGQKSRNFNLQMVNFSSWELGIGNIEEL